MVEDRRSGWWLEADRTEIGGCRSMDGAAGVAVAVVPSAASLSMEMKRSWEEKQAAGEKGERRGTTVGGR